MSEYQVEMSNISKSFGGIKALKGVSFKIIPGEIHALVGENGAGKSTLMKILSGVYKKETGEIKINGEYVQINNPHIGRKLGIRTIYQEFALIPDLSVAENIFLDSMIVKYGIIQWPKLYKKARKLIKNIGFDIDPKTLIGDLSIAYQQAIEICKALSEEAKILILDEPTSVLAPNEVELLFIILKKLKQKGVSIVYISHRLEEIFKIADRVTVLKDGQVTGSSTIGEIDKNEIINLMIGRRLEDMYPKRDVRIGNEIFKVKGLCNEKTRDISFSVKSGEVFGITGLVGSGRTEIIRAISGADFMEKGEIILENKVIKIKTPKDAVKHNIGMVPENRKEHGVILSITVKENLTMTNLNRIEKFGIIKEKEEKKYCQKLVDIFKIKTNSIEADVVSLSGGNQQKVSLAKWFGVNCKIIILDEPSRGVDVGAKVEIYKLINEFAKKGIGVIMVSSEMNEIIGMCDRVAVIYRGKIAKILNKNELFEKNIMKLAFFGEG